MAGSRNPDTADCSFMSSSRRREIIRIDFGQESIKRLDTFRCPHGPDYVRGRHESSAIASVFVVANQFAGFGINQMDLLACRTGHCLIRLITIVSAANPCMSMESGIWAAINETGHNGFIYAGPNGRILTCNKFGASNKWLYWVHP